MTQEELATASGVSLRTVRTLELSGRGYVGNLVAALRALGHEPVGDLPRKRIGRQRVTVRPIREGDDTPWYTPPHILEALHIVFGTFDLDPCSPDPPTVRCRRWYTEADDGLTKLWHGAIYMNPPYCAVPTWLAKAIDEFRTGRASKIIGLVPYLPHTNGWKTLVRSGAAIFVLEDRLRFGGRKHIAPSCSAVCVWGGSAADLGALGRVLPAHHRVIAAAGH